MQLRQRETVDQANIEVVQLKLPEVTHQDVARFFIGFEAWKVVFGLHEGFGQVFATAFVLDEQGAFPPVSYTHLTLPTSDLV